MKNFKENDIVTVTVTKVESYGAFVKINDFTGLIHISEINGKFVNNINNYFSEGKTITCRITGIDYKKKQLKLSMIDIDNRINYNQKNDLKETKLGFSELKKYLPFWIKNKEQEIKLSKIKKNN